MSKKEHLLVVVWAFVMLVIDVFDYGKAGLTTTLVASVVSFYIYYAIGLSFVFITTAIFNLYKKWRGGNTVQMVTIDMDGVTKTVKVESGSMEEVTKRAFKKAFNSDVEYKPLGKPMSKEEYLAKVGKQ